MLGADGWLRTGDLARVDEDGYYFIVGRAKELIIKGGLNIAPRLIDDVLESHPAVREAAALGVSDRYFGEDIVAFVVPKESMQLNERELLDYCETRLGTFKTPTRIYIVHDLPKGPSGKVQRLRLAGCFQDLLAADPRLAGVGARANGKAEGSAGGTSGASQAVVEEMIAATWAEVLKTDTVGLDENFFGLGGHSLLAIETLSRLRSRFVVDLSLNDFLSHPTVTQQALMLTEQLLGAADSLQAGEPEMADRVHVAIPADRAKLEAILVQRRRTVSNSVLIPRRDRSRPCPLSPAQQRLWFLEQMHPGDAGL